MKTGRANCWATREFEHEMKTGHLHFIDWLDFEEEFRKDFLLLDASGNRNLALSVFGCLWLSLAGVKIL